MDITPEETICWVPTCSNKNVLNKKFFPVPTSTSRLREIWLALATKCTKEVGTQQLYFCDDHFENISYDMLINNISFKPNGKLLVPNKNMPDIVCRTCNTLIDPKEPFYTMSSTSSADIPSDVADELKQIITIKPEPLNHVFKFCIKEFDVPTDPVPLVCKKCYSQIWLFFAYKKRAIEVEDFLCKDMTPEKYGTMVLCRSCPDSCSNFFPLGKDSEIGILLQKMFVNDYSPDVVPLRVCLNCYNILQKVFEFYKSCLRTEEIAKRRAILNEKLKMNTPSPASRNPPSLTFHKDRAFSKKVETENMVLAKLMLKFGHSIKDDLHNLEYWKPICVKLQEHGINHNIPSLINNWKMLTALTQEKLKSKAPLTPLENVVMQFSMIPSTLSVEVRPTTSQNVVSSEPARPSSIETASIAAQPSNAATRSNTIALSLAAKLSSSKTLSSATPSSAATPARLTRSDSKDVLSVCQPENKGNIRWGSSATPGTSKVKNVAKSSVSKPKQTNFSEKKTKILNESPQKTRTKRHFSPEDKLQFVNYLTYEFSQLTDSDKSNKNFWLSLVQTVMNKYLPNENLARLMYLWRVLRMSAITHEKDGSDPLDIAIWNMLQEYNGRNPTLHTSRKKLSKNEESPSTTTITTQDTPKVTPKAIIQDTRELAPTLIQQGTPKAMQQNTPKISNDKNSGALKILPVGSKGLQSQVEQNNHPPVKKIRLVPPQDWKYALQKQVFMLIRSTYMKMKKDNELEKHPKIWASIFNKIYEDGYTGVSKNEATEIWRKLRLLTYSETKSPLLSEVQQFLNKVNDDKLQKRSRQKKKQCGTSSGSDKKVDDSASNKAHRSYVNWTIQERMMLMQGMKENLSCYTETAECFWSKVWKYVVTSSGQSTKRTRFALNNQWVFLCKKLDLRLSRNLPLNDLYKNVKKLAHRLEVEKGKNKKQKTSPVEKFVIEELETVDLIEDSIKIQEESIKKEDDIGGILPTKQVDTCIDLENYSYVSLEDIQQSTSWDIPEVKYNPSNKDNNYKSVLLKKEGSIESDENQVSTSTTLGIIDDDDSNEYEDVAEYVGVNDLS